MSEFVKPKTVFVSDAEYIKNLVNINLQKDLCDDEEVCPYCHGTGMTVYNHSYGLSDDPDRTINRLFPYRHQSITFCRHCYDGVVHRCKLCGEILPKGMSKHYCAQQQEADRKERAAKEMAEFENAPIAPEEVVDSCFYLYSNDYPNNEGYFCDWDEFFESWHEEHDENDDRPEFVWITEPVEMSVDVQDIIENATYNLYEDASEDITSEARKELQDFIDGWCKRCGVGTTYYESHKYKVRIPWERY